MKINNISLTAAALALAIVASAQAAAPASVVKSGKSNEISPFVRTEVGIVSSPKNTANGGTSFATSFDDFKSETAPGFTAGVLLNQRHELSISTGYVQFEGSPVVTAGVASSNGKVEQVPVLFNYAYHLPVDSKGKWTVYGGPTIGLIHQTSSLTVTQLGGAPASSIGTNSVSENLFAYGATIGVKGKLSSHWTVGASALVLEVGSSGGVSFPSLTVKSLEFGSATRTFFALTAGYSW